MYAHNLKKNFFLTYYLFHQALLEGENQGTPDAVVKIKLIAPPLYVMTTMALDKEYGIEVLNKAIATVNEKVIAKG